MSRQQNLGQYCFYIHVMSGFSYLIFVRDMGSESTSRWWLRSGLSFLMMQGGGLRAPAAQQYSTACFKHNVFFFLLGKQCYNSKIAAKIYSSKNCSGGCFSPERFPANQHLSCTTNLLDHLVVWNS
jgi:hypothetical protein